MNLFTGGEEFCFSFPTLMPFIFLMQSVLLIINVVASCLILIIIARDAYLDVVNKLL